MPPPVPVRSLAPRLLSELSLRNSLDPASHLSPQSNLPTSTSQYVASRIVPRILASASTVPEGYGKFPNGPDAGTVVGIVLGSVAGFLLILWLIYTCVNLGNSNNNVVDTGSVGTASVVTRKSRRHRRRRTHHSRSHSPRRETVEIRRERVVPAPMPPPPPEPDRIVVEERTSRSRTPHMPVPMPMPPPPQPISDDEDDEVVVIEENTPPRKRESRHKRRISERRSGGYREVDPYLYAGGEAPMREMSRIRSGSRRR